MQRICTAPGELRWRVESGSCTLSDAAMCNRHRCDISNRSMLVPYMPFAASTCFLRFGLTSYTVLGSHRGVWTIKFFGMRDCVN